MDYMQNNYRLIITGGPGSGKTSLIRALKLSGFNTFPEIAGELIAKGAIPPIRSKDEKKNRDFFRNILSERIELHQSAPSDQLSFYDRGIPDSLSFFKFRKLKAPDLLLEAINEYRYNVNVFILPPRIEVFSNNFIRQESFKQAVELYENTIDSYTISGYKLIELKEVSVELRAKEITRNIKSMGIIEL